MIRRLGLAPLTLPRRPPTEEEPPPGDELSLPAGVAIWYAGDGSGVHASLTTAGNGQPATGWNGGGAYDLAPYSSYDGPTVTVADSGFNNRGTLTFDGVNDMLRNGSLYLVSHSNPFTVATVLSFTTTSAAVPFCETAWNHGFAHNTLYLNETTPTPHVRIRLAPTFTGSMYLNAPSLTGLNDGNPHLILWRTNGTAYTLRIDGSQVATGTNTVDPATHEANSVTLGCFSSGLTESKWFPGKLALVGGWAADNYAAIEADIMTHYGI